MGFSGQGENGWKGSPGGSQGNSARLTEQNILGHRCVYIFNLC